VAPVSIRFGALLPVGLAVLVLASIGFIALGLVFASACATPKASTW